ncbi:MAG TPA: HAD family phosphatase [Bacteroidales bacterium]|nr:HAD family phosphatase [Bacteroidales bacterium]HRR92495.1 HAD family phosphatase [Bacteroidales bacterium]HRT88523.1 HAD family phosphatase [Bacteroidales bacterium]
MITSIIFDLGNVLLNWKPAEYLEQNGFTDPGKSLILSDIFNSPEWLKIDNGDLTVEEAIKIISDRSPLSEDKIRTVFDLRLKIIFPLHPNTDLLPELKKRGYRLYYLSNFPDDIFDEVQKKYCFFQYFDGGKISARLRASKPDEKIFRIFLSAYSLLPSECLFIDDSDVNAGAAEKLGIKTIHLKTPGMLKSALEKSLGITLDIN